MDIFMFINNIIITIYELFSSIILSLCSHALPSKIVYDTLELFREGFNALGFPCC